MTKNTSTYCRIKVTKKAPVDNHIYSAFYFLFSGEYRSRTDYLLTASQTL